MNELWEKITDVWWNCTRPWRIFTAGVSNLWTWKGIIWNDRNWDYSFILILLEKKLSLIEEFYKSDDCWWANPEPEIKNIHNTRIVLKRLIDNEYDNPYWKRVWDMNDGDDFLGHLNNMSDLESRLIRMAGKHDDIQMKQDLEYVTSMLRKHITKWWD